MYSGQIIICVESFFVFERGHKYYCTRESDGYFYIHNSTGEYNVQEIKLSAKLKSCFTLLG